MLIQFTDVYTGEPIFIHPEAVDTIVQMKEMTSEFIGFHPRRTQITVMGRTAVFVADDAIVVHEKLFGKSATP